MQLFRRAFTTRICDHHLLYPPFYIPGNVLHPSYPYPGPTGFSPYNHHLNLPASEAAPPRQSRGCQEEYRHALVSTSASLDPRRLREEFLFHIHWGVIVRRSLTNFLPPSFPIDRHKRYTLASMRPSAHLNPSPRSSENLSPSLSLFLSLSWCFAPSDLCRSASVHPPPFAIPPPTAPRKAWSTATTAQGPILPTHNLQFHILFPSRVRQQGVGVQGGGYTRINSFLPPSRQSSFLLGLSVVSYGRRGSARKSTELLFMISELVGGGSCLSSLGLEIVMYKEQCKRCKNSVVEDTL